jgi:hypothetical protein
VALAKVLIRLTQAMRFLYVISICGWGIFVKTALQFSRIGSWIGVSGTPSGNLFMPRLCCCRNVMKNQLSNEIQINAVCFAAIILCVLGASAILPLVHVNRKEYFDCKGQ